MPARTRTLSYDHIGPFKDVDGEPYAVNAIVETPRGDRNKYAYNEELGVFTLSATLRPQMEWPCDFGFIPQTLGDDGDALDVCLFLDASAYPGTLVYARIIGSIDLEEDGERNPRLIGVMVPKKSTSISTREVHELTDVHEGIVTGLETFLRTYPDIGGHTIRLRGRLRAADALELIHDGHRRWSQRQRAAG